MSELHWLRTEWKESFATPEGHRISILRGLRSDGQPFATWAKFGPETTPEILRKALDGMLNDPALPFVANADEQTRKRFCLMHKGVGNWIEESAG
jgi:hypothetical protein